MSSSDSYYHTYLKNYVKNTTDGYFYIRKSNIKWYYRDKMKKGLLATDEFLDIKNHIDRMSNEEFLFACKHRCIRLTDNYTVTTETEVESDEE